MNRHEVEAILRTVDDPEMPINIVDLGIVSKVRAEGGAVEVEITPTFVGCPALDVLRATILDRLRAAGAADPRVTFVNDPPWTVERISDAGRAALRAHGVTTPERGFPRQLAASGFVSLTISSIESVECPYCGSDRTHLESPFGPTRCRMIYYCDACRNQFEHMKAI